MSAKKGSIVIDTGVLLEYIEGTELGRKFKEHVLQNESLEHFYISPFVHTELLYIICRNSGFDQAQKTVTKFLRRFILFEEKKLRDVAAKLKCQYPISLADCYSIALALIQEIPLYMKREAEIEALLNQGAFTTQIIFIDDI